MKIEAITELPDVPLMPYSAEEVRLAGDAVHELVRRSELAYLVSTENGPGLIFGIRRTTLLGFPYLWFLLCRRPTLPELVLLRKKKRELLAAYPEFMTGIEETFEEGKRFAKFLRLQRTEHTFEIMGRVLTLYKGTA